MSKKDRGLNFHKQKLNFVLLGFLLLLMVVLFSQIAGGMYRSSAIIGLLIFFFLIINKYQVGLYFIIILLPLFQAISINSTSTSSTGLNVQYILIPLVWFAWFFEKTYKKELRHVVLPLLGIITGFLFAIILSMINQADIVNTNLIKNGSIQFYALTCYVVLFYIIVNERISETTLQNIFWGMVFVALIASIIGFFQYFDLLKSPNTVKRVTSVFGSILRKDETANPNAFGTYLVFILMVIFYLWSHSGRSGRIVLVFCSLLVFSSLLLSFSRSSLLALFFAIWSYTFFKSKKVFIGAIGISIICLIALYFEPTFHDRIDSIYTILSSKRVIKLFLNINPQTLDWSYVNYYGIQGYNSDVISGAFRIYAWLQGIYLFIDHPWFGIGYHFTSAFSHWPTAENLYLDFASMTGIFGLLFFILLQVAFLRAGYRLKNNQRFSLGVFWLNILAIIFFVSITGSILFNGKLLGIFWIIAGLVYSQLYNEKFNIYSK